MLQHCKRLILNELNTDKWQHVSVRLITSSFTYTIWYTVNIYWKTCIQEVYEIILLSLWVDLYWFMFKIEEFQKFYKIYCGSVDLGSMVIVTTCIKCNIL